MQSLDMEIDDFVENEGDNVALLPTQRAISEESSWNQINPFANASTSTSAHSSPSEWPSKDAQLQEEFYGLQPPHRQQQPPPLLRRRCGRYHTLATAVAACLSLWLCFALVVWFVGALGWFVPPLRDDDSSSSRGTPPTVKPDTGSSDSSSDSSDSSSSSSSSDSSNGWETRGSPSSAPTWFDREDPGLFGGGWKVCTYYRVVQNRSSYTIHFFLFSQSLECI